jgi:hypothetical protein
VRVIEVTHPLFERVLEAHGFRRLKGELRLAVTLPDGSAATVAAAATDVLGAGEQAEPTVVTVLSLEGVRRLRVLVEARSRGRGNRGTDRLTT